MAPEAYEDNKNYDGILTDMWSLGAILASMLTARSLYTIPARSDERFAVLADGVCPDTGRVSTATLRTLFPGTALSPAVVDLLGGILIADQPQRRTRPPQALVHPWSQQTCTSGGDETPERTRSLSFFAVVPWARSKDPTALSPTPVAQGRPLVREYTGQSDTSEASRGVAESPHARGGHSRNNSWSSNGSIPTGGRGASIPVGIRGSSVESCRLVPDVSPGLRRVTEGAAVEGPARSPEGRYGGIGVTRRQWHPNAPSCAICRLDFGVFRGRHHCRGCGINVCEACSLQTMVLPPEFGYNNKLVKICDNCAGRAGL